MRISLLLPIAAALAAAAVGSSGQAIAKSRGGDNRPAPVVRDHRTPPTVRDHRTTAPVVRDHRTTAPVVRDHRVTPKVNANRATPKVTATPTVRDHRATPTVRDHRVTPAAITAPLRRSATTACGRGRSRHLRHAPAGDSCREARAGSGDSGGTPHAASAEPHVRALPGPTRLVATRKRVRAPVAVHGPPPPRTPAFSNRCDRENKFACCTRRCKWRRIFLQAAEFDAGLPAALGPRAC